MTKREAAIVAAYTGYMIGSFTDLHAYIEELFQRQVHTHELGSPQFMVEVKEKAKSDFCALSTAR